MSEQRFVVVKGGVYERIPGGRYQKSARWIVEQLNTLESDNAALRERVAELEAALTAVAGLLPNPNSPSLDYPARVARQVDRALAASKRAGGAEVAESSERMADKHDDTLRDLAGEEGD